jgi:hypothetical protein
MTLEKQLKEWLKGNSIHDSINNRCCPDFSCCYGKDFLAKKRVRKRFAEAYYCGELITVTNMLIAFTERLFPPELIVEERHLSLATIH